MQSSSVPGAFVLESAMAEKALRSDPLPVAEVAAMTTSSPFLNRELSLLEFNYRVLEQARDASTPLLERLRFLTISSSNLDEFFEIRVAGLKHQIEAGIVKPGADGLRPDELLARIAA